MSSTDETMQRLILAVIPLTGVIAVVVLSRRGCLSHDAFAAAPPRTTGLGLGDLAAGLAMIIALGLALPGVATMVGINRLPADSPQRLAAYAMLGQLAGLLPVVVYVLARAAGGTGGVAALGLTSHRPRRDLRLAAWGLLLAIVLVQGLTAMIVFVIARFGHVPPPVGHDLLAALIETDSRPAAFIILVSALVLAPLFEEVIYRGLVQSALLAHFGTAARWPVILAAAALFGLIHAGAAAWHVLPGLFVLGILLGWLYERTGSLLAPVLVHMGFNVLNVAMAMLMVHAAGDAAATVGL